MRTRFAFISWAVAAGAAALGMFSGPAWAQGPQPPLLKWTARERYPNQTGPNANDEAKDIVYWEEKDEFNQVIGRWIYMTGWVTELNQNGSVKGTRFATFKYDATDPGTNGAPITQAAAYFPPTGTGISQGDTYKGVAMTVDPVSGDIYMTGEGPHAAGVANNQDYYMIRYNKALDTVWTGNNGARTYEGPVGGNDIPADIALSQFNEVLVVSGTSPGNGTGLDIASVAWFAGSGERAGDPVYHVDYWFDVGFGEGVRRYDGPAHGDDRAVEIGPVNLAQYLQSPIQLEAIILGTSWGGANTKNDFTLHRWNTDPNNNFDMRFDMGLNDTATGLWYINTSAIYCCGYSEIPPDQFDGLGENPDDVPPPPPDYSVVSYEYDLYPPSAPQELWRDHRDYAGGPDYSADIIGQVIENVGTHLWITGEGKTGTRRDVYTIHYLDTGAAGHTPDWTAGFNVGGSTTFNYGKAVTLPNQPGIPVLPYITGATGYANNDWMLALKYKDTPTPYTLQWFRTYSIGAFDEGRAIVVRQVDGAATNVSVYIAGASSATGNGRDFCTWRYRE